MCVCVIFPISREKQGSMEIKVSRKFCKLTAASAYKKLIRMASKVRHKGVKRKEAVAREQKRTENEIK